MSSYKWLVLLCCMSWAASAFAGQGFECDTPCGNNISCHDRQLRCLAAKGETQKAIEKAKELKKAKPHDPRWSMLLARSYDAAGNHFWAVKTMQQHLVNFPDDCAAPAYLAWLHLKQGDLDLAKQALASERCPKTQADSARWALLLSIIAKTSGDREKSAELLRRTRTFREIYPEDARMEESLLMQIDPTWTQPVYMNAELAAGMTSNISAGLPVTQAGADKASGLIKLDLFGRWIWPLWPRVRPTVELGAKLNNLDDFNYKDDVDVHQANYFDGSVRLGLRLSVGSMPGFIGYRADVFSLNQGDRFEKAPVVFYEGHRLELELEPGGDLMLFAGGGRRLFRQISRSRTELDGGIGWSFSPWRSLQVLAALSLRYYSSDGQLYDQTGATAILVGKLGLPVGMYLRASLSTGFDWYPNAAPEGTSDTMNNGGTDLLVKPSLAAWGPSWGDFRIGLSYEYSRRISDTSISYSYSDHRIFLKAKWTYESDPWEPERVRQADRLELPWNRQGESGSAFDEERIQDLLRQDEASRRGSSCVN